MVRPAPTPAEFRAAVDAYRFAAPPLELPRTELLLIGEAHGVSSRMPAVLERVTARLGPFALAFEWSHEELDPLLERFMTSGTFDLDELWRLPPGAEAFARDGRFTAGHVALLERLWRERRLAQVIAVDRLDPTPPAPQQSRDRDLAARLLEQWQRVRPIVCVVGAAHALDAPGTMADALDVDAAMFDYGAAVEMPPAAVRIPVPPGPPPVVPGR